MYRFFNTTFIMINNTLWQSFLQIMILYLLNWIFLVVEWHLSRPQTRISCAMSIRQLHVQTYTWGEILRSPEPGNEKKVLFPTWPNRWCNSEPPISWFSYTTDVVRGGGLYLEHYILWLWTWILIQSSHMQTFTGNRGQ